MKNPSQRISTHPITGMVHVETVNDEPSMTQQQFKDECDINNIMKKYATTGQFTHVTSKEGAYGDFSSIPDYKSALDTVRYADEAFAHLPPDLRLRFSNDPGKLIEFMQDPKNYDEGVKLGLLNKRDVDATELPKLAEEATISSKKRDKKAEPKSKLDESTDS